MTPRPHPSLNAGEGWTPLTVHWDDESGRKREVVKACARCLPNGRQGLYVSVVSPSGVMHEARRGDTTDCGRDCTGPDWWIRL